MAFSLENILLIGSLLLFLSLIAGKTGYRFGVPVLVLFLGVGMLAGSDGILGIHFSNSKVAQFIGMISLSVILFSGGMDTKYEEIKPVARQGILLATVGVLLTALITGVLIYWITNTFFKPITFTFFESMLLASIMASTDSASVFSILRSRGLHLRFRLRPLLELESGSNDPMAYLLMIAFMQLIQTGEGNLGTIVGMFFYQLVIGALAGFLLGKLSVRVINRINLANNALYPVLLFTVSLLIFAFTDFIKGNGYLAVYIGGLVIGNSKFIHKRTSKSFFDGLAWLCQIIMFLTLGLLVNPSELLPVAGIGLIVAFLLILISRPLAVFVTLLPFRKMPDRTKHYISWVGLRGAVPIVFATYPLMADLPQAHTIFNIVFFVTIVSLLVQGTSVPLVARVLGLSKERKIDRELSAFDVEFSDDIKSVMAELTVTKEHLKGRSKLIDFPFPENTLVAMIKRQDYYFVPDGHSELLPNDVLLLLSDNQEALEKLLENPAIPPKDDSSPS